MSEALIPFLVFVLIANGFAAALMFIMLVAGWLSTEEPHG